MLLQKGLDPPLYPGLGSAAAKLAIVELRSSGPVLAPDDLRLPALKRNGCTRNQGLGGLGTGELGVDPVALVERPGERRTPTRPPRTGELKRACCLVESKTQPPRRS